MSGTTPKVNAGTLTVEVAAVPLTTLRGGDRASVCHREMTCSDCDLLNAMGLTDRCVLRICRVGEPCIVQVSTTRLGLSADVAKRILVRPERG